MKVSKIEAIKAVKDTMLDDMYNSYQIDKEQVKKLGNQIENGNTPFWLQRKLDQYLDAFYWGVNNIKGE